MTGQMGFVVAAYAVGLVALAAMLVTSFSWMRRAEARAEELKKARRR